MTQPLRYFIAFAFAVAASDLTSLLLIAAHLPVVTPVAMVTFAFSSLGFLLLTRRRKRRPVQPEPCCCGRPGCDGRGPWPGETT